MTNEEMQNTMEFILEQQAQFAVNIRRLQEQHGGRERCAGRQVESHVADISAALAIDQHVVAVRGGVLRKVRVLLDPMAVEAQQLALAHRDDQQAAIRQPAQA